MFIIPISIHKNLCRTQFGMQQRFLIMYNKLRKLKTA